jgi:hypothetical protein
MGGSGGITAENCQPPQSSASGASRQERRVLDPEVTVATVEKSSRERIHIVISVWKNERRLYLRIHRPDILGRWLPSQDGFARPKQGLGIESRPRSGRALGVAT